MSTTFLKRALSPVANYAALPATGSALKLYLDEATVSPTSGFARLKTHIDQLTRVMAAADWSALRAG